MKMKGVTSVSIEVFKLRCGVQTVSRVSFTIVVTNKNMTRPFAMIQSMEKCRVNQMTPDGDPACPGETSKKV
jgi:hypothetical protein